MAFRRCLLLCNLLIHSFCWRTMLAGDILLLALPCLACGWRGSAKLSDMCRHRQKLSQKVICERDMKTTVDRSQPGLPVEQSSTAQAALCGFAAALLPMPPLFPFSSLSSALQFHK